MNSKTIASQVRAALRRIAVSVAALALVFLVPAGNAAQHNNGRQSAPHTQPRPQQSRPAPPQPRLQQRQYENRTAPPRPAYNSPSYSQPVRPAMGVQEQRGNSQSQAAPRQEYYGTGAAVRPALPGSQPNNPAAPPGHLGSWLSQHGNLPLQGQQQLLRNNPSFKNLPQTDQQRLMRQLQQVNQLPEQERQRRLARAETLERMSPQERMQLNQASRQLSSLAPDRQTVVKRAFRDLRGVPLDQRQTVLDSQRYQGQFTPEERGILGNLLRAEPYQPQQ